MMRHGWVATLYFFIFVQEWVIQNVKDNAGADLGDVATGQGDVGQHDAGQLHGAAAALDTGPDNVPHGAATALVIDPNTELPGKMVHVRVNEIGQESGEVADDDRMDIRPLIN